MPLKAGEAMKVPVDDLDHKLISLLMEDASQTNAALARELGVSDGTVRNRIQRLIDLGVMQIVAIIDPWKVGRRLQVHIGIHAEPGQLHDLVEALQALEETTYVGYATGEYDCIVVAALASEEDLFRFLTQRLTVLPGLRSLRTSVILKAVKRTFRYDRGLKQTEEGSETSREAAPNGQFWIEPEPARKLGRAE